MNWRPRIGSEGGATSLATLLIGVALAGVIIGALLGFSGAVDLFDDPTTAAVGAVAPYYECPGGDRLDDFHRGDRVFVTGVDASGGWVAVRSPVDMAARVWVDARHVDPDGPYDDLPVLDCLVPVEAIVVAAETTTTTTEAPETTATTEAPDTTATTEAPTTTETTATTQATGTTGTTQAADTTPPSISQASASPGTIWEQDGLGVTCPGGTPRQSTMSATVTDNTGVTSVAASWTDPFGSQNVAMGNTGNVYSLSFGPYAAGDWDAVSTAPYDHAVPVTITARDGAGNQSSTSVNVTVIEIGECFG